MYVGYMWSICGICGSGACVGCLYGDVCVMGYRYVSGSQCGLYKMCCVWSVCVHVGQGVWSV